MVVYNFTEIEGTFSVPFRLRSGLLIAPWDQRFGRKMDWIPWNGFHWFDSER